MNKRAVTSDEIIERDEIEKSLKTSTYITDEWWEAVLAKTHPKVNVPNYNQSNSNEVFSNETEGLSIGLDDLYKASSSDNDNSSVRNEINKKSIQKLSKNQAMAIKKYPTIVEFLGQENGDKIAKKILSEMNTYISEIVKKNSKEANDYAITCEADKQNLKQYFQGDGWLCRVTASGPFRGDEAIYYSRERDIARVLRRQEENDHVKYSDVTDQFNLVYEVEEGDFSKIEEVVSEIKSDDNQVREIK